MADKGSKIVVDIVKAVENRIVKIEKELQSQQELVKKLVGCINDLSCLVKTLPEKEIKKFMAFKYPFPSKELKLDLELEEPSGKILVTDEKIEQFSELALSENEEFSLSFETLEIIENL